MKKKTRPKDICQTFCFNKEKVAKVKRSLLPKEELNVLIEIFSAVSDETRIKIILSLKKEELCVCDISHVLGMSISAVSHQLRILRSLRLVKYRKEGKLVFYSLADKCVIKLINECVRHIKES